MKYILGLFLFVLVGLNAQNKFYYTEIISYHVDFYIDDNYDISKVEKIHFLDRQNELVEMYGEHIIKKKDPTFWIDLPHGLFIDNLEIFLDDKLFEQNQPNSSSLISLKPRYQEDSNYHFTIKYTDIATPKYLNEHSDKLEFDLVNHHFDPLRKFTANVHLPSMLNKQNVTLHNSGRANIHWLSDNHFTMILNNLHSNELVLNITYPKGLIGNTVKPHKKTIRNIYEGKSFMNERKGLDNLIYWLIVFFIVYMIFLFYYARSYGSSATFGFLPVQYGPPKDVTLLQSGFIIDEKHDTIDLVAAIIELVSMGYIKIEDKRETRGSYYLKKLKNSSERLSTEQKYLMNKILFPVYDMFNLNSDKRNVYRNIDTLKKNIYYELKLDGFIYFDLNKAKRYFKIKAYLTAIPLIGFTIYTAHILYGSAISYKLFWFMIIFMSYLLIATLLGKSTLNDIIAISLMFFFPYLLLTWQGSWKEFILSPVVIFPIVALVISYYTGRISWLTGKGLKAHRELLGYKEFVKRTDLPKIQYILKEHPDHIELSVAYALLFNLMKHDLQSEFKK